VIDLEAELTTYLTPLVSGLAIVVGNTPEDIDQAWVRVRMIGTQPAGNADADILKAHHVQFDCYAGTPGKEGQGEAVNLYESVRAALVGFPAAVADVSAVRFTNALRMPDESLRPPRQRFILDARIHVR
jgi:formylmethanofuran dehydrogenase subunit A